MLAEHLRVGDGTDPFALPLNIHRTNVLYYNVARRAAFEESTGKNLLLLETLCPADADDPSAPALEASFAAAFGGQPWPLVPLVFEKANLYAQVSCGSDGRIAGFYVKPLQLPAR